MKYSTPCFSWLDLTERLIDFACSCLGLEERLPTILTGNYNCLLLITKLKWINELEGKTILKENDGLIAIFISSCKTAHKNLLINKTYEGPNF